MIPARALAPTILLSGSQEIAAANSICSSNDFAWHNYALLAELPVLDDGVIPGNHAVLARTFTTLDTYSFPQTDWQVEARDPSEPVIAVIGYRELSIVTVEGLTVTPPKISLESGVEEQWPRLVIDRGGWFAVNSTLYVGRDCDDYAGVVAQLSGFDIEIGDYERDKDKQGEAIAEIRRIINAMRGVPLDAVVFAAIQEGLATLTPINSQLANRSFTLTFDERGWPSLSE